MTHTPGPWRVFHIRMNEFEIWDEYENFPADMSDEAMKANARLIAAAPEMLAALHDALDYLYNDGGELRRAMCAAIAKAEAQP